MAAGHHRALSVPKKDSSARMGKEAVVRRSKIAINHRVKHLFYLYAINSVFFGHFAKQDKKPSKIGKVTLKVDPNIRKIH